MRFHGRFRLAIAVLVALAPAAASALSYVGRLGLGYDRLESWTEDAHGLQPKLRLDGSLDADGFVVEPGIVDWAARVGYADTNDTYGGATTKSGELTYRANLDLLQKREARARLSASATRTRTDFSTDVAAVQTTGTSTSDSYSISAGTRIPGLPTLSSGFSYTDSVELGFDRPELRQTSKALDLGMRFGQPSLDSAINYRSQWDSGSIAPLNYTSQHVDAQATAHPTEDLTGSLGLAYFVREPTILGATNPGFENALVNGNVTWGNPRETFGSASYRYDLAYATDPSLDSRSAIGNTATLAYGRRISTDWRWTGSASGSVSQSRNGATESSAMGQSAGLTAYFARKMIGASLGAQAGMLEPEHGTNAFAYGLTGSANANWQRSRQSFGFSYTASYTQNLEAKAGWTANQTLYGDVTDTVTAFLSWSARLQASSLRGGGGPFGNSAQRSIAAGGSLYYRHATLDLQLGTSDSLSGALANPLSDGLFIPAGFDTHARYAVLTGAVPVMRTLTASAFAKYAMFSGPATPEQREAAAGGALGYILGRWTLSLADMYTVGGTTAFDHRINQLYVRASMTFGGR